MLRALGEYEIDGLKTLIPFHIGAAGHRAVGATPRPAATWSRTRTGSSSSPSRSRRSPPKARTRTRRSSRTYTVEVSGKRFDVKVIGEALRRRAAANGAAPAARPRQAPKRGERKRGGGGGAATTLDSPLQGNVWKVPVEQGAEVDEGEISSSSRR